MKKKKYYFKPKISIKKIQVAFLSARRRSQDAMNSIEDGMLLANWQCSPCCSCCCE